jgi:hypothetical protein
MLKAIGVGLSFALNDVEVTLEHGRPAQLLAIRNAPASETQSWRLHHLEPAPGYVAAIAAQRGTEPIAGPFWMPALP